MGDYSLGKNGHAVSCKCGDCYVGKVERYLADPTVREPKTRDATVLVRAHLRRQANHLRKDPKAKAALRALLKRSF